MKLPTVQGVAIVLCILFLRSIGLAEGTVVTYPAPASEKVSGAYSVTVDGKPVDVYSAASEYFGGDYYFAYFDFEGSVKIEIRSEYPLDKAAVLPASFGLPMETTSERAIITADKPFRVSFEPNGRIKPLLIFGNGLETDVVPASNAKDVVYFGPGVHKPGKIELTSNQTLYLAGGAVVKGCIHAVGENITIRGRGVLAGEESPRFQGPGRFLLDCQNCSQLTVRDIILRNPWSWTAVTWNCRGVLIDGLKICGSRMINDDALDLVNSQDVIVRNCFFRTQDDSIAIKGIDASKLPCENILVENCQFWTDLANIYRIGYECDAAVMKHIVSKNIDVLHYSKNYREPSHYWSNAIIWLQPNLNMLIDDCQFENFTVYSDGTEMILLMAKPMRCSYGAHKEPDPGTLKNCSFKNISLVGKKGDFKGLIFLAGESEKWSVTGLTFENVQYFGERITRESPCVHCGNHVSNIEFR